MHRERKVWLVLVFLVICFGVATFASQFTPGPWYESLNKAPWTPPPLAFPIVWSILYTMIAVVGWLLFTQTDASLKALWCAQLVLNAAWSWLFFGQHWVGWALVDIVLLGLILAILIVLCLRRGQRPAGLLLLPYLVWIGLASSLNAYVLIFN